MAVNQYCHVHPRVKTGLRCSQCDRPICPRDVIHTPVGSKCKDCARLRKMPPFDVTTKHYFRASLIGIIIALIGGLVIGILATIISSLLGWILLVGVGYLMGEGISLATNRKRGVGLMAMAVACLCITHIVSLIWMAQIRLDSIWQGLNLVSLFSLILALYIAVRRVR